MKLVGIRTYKPKPGTTERFVAAFQDTLSASRSFDSIAAKLLRVIKPQSQHGASFTRIGPAPPCVRPASGCMLREKGPCQRREANPAFHKEQPV